MDLGSHTIKGQEKCRGVVDTNRLHNDITSNLNTTVSQENFGPSQNTECWKIEPFDLESAPTPSENLQNHFVPLSSLPSVEAAFSISKIRERIFSYMNPLELLQLRLVSQDWRRDATNENLLNWEENYIRIGKMSVCRIFTCLTISGYRRFKEPVLELTTLMNATASYPFPCTQFEIILSNCENEGDEIQAFLTNHGSRIRKLTLHLYYLETCKYFSGTNQICFHKEKWVLQILTKLLLLQLPNLVEIQVQFSSYGPGKNVCEKSIGNSLTINRSSYPRVYNTKLRSASISNNLLVSVFDCICDLAPNLTDFECDHLNYYLEPTNRLHLLKELIYHPHSSDPKKNLLVKSIANTQGTLHLNTLDIGILSLSMIRFPENWPEIADIINKLLEKCCHSLKRLEMKPLGFLPGLKFPRMQKVDEIFLDSLPPFDKHPFHFFPGGVRLSDIFPNWSTLHYCLIMGIEKNCIKDDFFLLCSEKEVLTSVTEIRVNWDPFISENSKRWFPNAKIMTLGSP